MKHIKTKTLEGNTMNPNITPPSQTNTPAGDFVLPADLSLYCPDGFVLPGHKSLSLPLNN